MDYSAPLAAVVVPVLAVALGWVTVWWRSESYGRQEDFRKESARSRAARLGIADTWPSDIDEHFRGIHTAYLNAHQRAITLQTAYARSLTTTIVSLIVSFTCSALSATILHDSELFLSFAGYCELVAFAIVLASFVRGRSLNRQWVRARTLSELFRQYYFVAAFLQGSPGNALAAPSLSPLEPSAKQAADIWRQWRGDLERRTYADIPIDHMIGYVRHRAIVQEAWFQASHERLEGTENRRGKILLSLYVVACVLVVLKIFAPSLPGARLLCALGLPAEAYHATLLFALLEASGLSGAMTAFYVSQNNRSLMHRYRSQKDWLSKIIDDFSSRLLSNLPNRAGPCQDAAMCTTYVELVLELEELMNDELIDWIHISSHDALELSA